MREASPGSLTEVRKWPHRPEEAQRGWGLQALEESGLRRRASMGTLPFPPTWRPPKAGLPAACPRGRMSLALWVQRPRPCPTASEGSLTGGPLSDIRSCPGRRRVPLWRLCSGGVPKGLDRAWAGPQQAACSQDQLPCPFPASGNVLSPGP